jgi:hypothetical protein
MDAKCQLASRFVRVRFIIIPAIRWVWHAGLLYHYLPDWLFDAEGPTVTLDQGNRFTCVRYPYAVALSLQNCDHLRHHLQCTFEHAFAHLHVQSTHVSWQQNAMFIFSAPTP